VKSIAIVTPKQASVQICICSHTKNWLLL